MRRFSCLLLLFLLPLLAGAEGLTLDIADVQGFQPNPIIIHTPMPGMLALSISDEYGVYRSWTLKVAAGDIALEWDGLGMHEEILPEGTYRLLAFLDGSETLTAEKQFTVAKSRNALLFALPKSPEFDPEADGKWICEMRLARSGGTVVTEFYRCDQPDMLLDVKRNKVSPGVFINYAWDGTIAGQKAQPGDYLLRFYEQSNPAYVREVVVSITAGSRVQHAVAPTGPIMPSAGMSEAEIWALMQKPSVVADLPEQTDHLSLRKGKGSGKALGTIHGQSQAVEVLEVDGKYALIGAWTHESGEYTEGWVETRKLKVVQPDRRYGLVVDKAAQTLTVWENGAVMGIIPISTGLPAEDKLFRETPAGSFLTADRVSNFKDEDEYWYTCAIRYDGGNLLHQIGYRKQNGKRDFSVQAAQLGVKASHGCIRIPQQAGDAALNAYWLYTHLPYGTRVIVLDDPEQRALQRLAAGEQVSLPSLSPTEPPPLHPEETELTLTVGGDVVLGTREAWWTREDALPAFLNRCGYDYPFAKLHSLFSEDDMTLVNLECVLKDDPRGENTDKEYRFRGLPEWTACLTSSGIDQVSIANNHYIDYGPEGREATQTALQAAGIAFSGFETTYIWQQDGWKIGFAGCRETVYKQDPTVVSRDIRNLKDAGCDVVIYTCHWGKEYAPTHNRLQTRIAAAAAAAGADIVIGGHPHVVQGVDTVGRVPVLYSLGNLMFGGTIDMRTFDGMLAQIKLRFDAQGYAGCTIQLIPILTSSSANKGINDYQPAFAEGSDRERILQAVQNDTPFPLAESMYFPH